MLWVIRQQDTQHTAGSVPFLCIAPVFARSNRYYDTDVESQTSAVVGIQHERNFADVLRCPPFHHVPSYQISVFGHIERPIGDNAIREWIFVVWIWNGYSRPVS